jgi:hypothetical protein
MRILFTATHNVAEGAGAAPLAAALQERDRLRGKRVAVIQSGGNIDRDLFAEILAEQEVARPAWKGALDRAKLRLWNSLTSCSRSRSSSILARTIGGITSFSTASSSRWRRPQRRIK